MSHEITKSDRLVLNSGEKAWHGLGTVVDQDLSPSEAVRMVLGWEPEPEPVYFKNAKSGLYEVASGYKANVRNDTQECLGIVSDGYKIVPNRVFGEFAEAIHGADAAFQTETCGSLMGGKRVFMLVKCPKSIRVGNGGEDESVPYLVMSNTHDGTSALFAMWTSVRVVCNNTLSMALGSNFENAEEQADRGRAFRFRHSGNVLEKVDEARRMLAIATTTTERFQVLADQLARRQLVTADLTSYFTACYVAIYGERPTDPKDIEHAEMWDERLAARLAEWEGLMSDPKQNVAGVGGTLWAAMNAVTQWHDHVRSASRVQNGRRQHSNLFGESARDKRGAFVAAVAMLGA